MKSTRALLVFALLAGCGSAEVTVDEVATSYLSDTQASVRDCGRILLGQCTESRLPEAERAKLACLADCGSRLQIEQPTVEGNPIYTVYVRTPSGSACVTAVFVDTRADQLGPQKITTERCQIETDDASCTPVTLSDCVPFDSGRD